MIYTQDNFLPQDEFIALKDRCERRFIAKDGWGTEPVRVTHHDAKGDWNEGCNFLGRECVSQTQKIITTMEELGIKDLDNWSIWFQYIINKMTVIPHRDGALRSSDQANTYTAIVYTSDWQDGWGGEFIVGQPVYDGPGHPVGLTDLTHTIKPIPNRLLIWSRDEWHAVNEVTHDDPDYKRSFYGTGWSSIDCNLKFSGPGA